MKTLAHASVIALLAAALVGLSACALESTDGSGASDGYADSIAARADVVVPGPPRVGEVYAFALPTVAGDLVGHESLRGKVVVLDFWATWCGPCRKELPHLRELYDAYRDDGLEIVGLSFDRRLGDLSRFLEDDELPWPQVFLGDLQRQVGENTGVTSIPRFFVLDAEGRLVTTQGRGQLDELLPKLLAEAARGV